MKSGYWYQRARTSRQQQNISTSLQFVSTHNSRVVEREREQERKDSSGYLESKSNQIGSLMSKVSKIEDYYQILCQEEYTKLAVRCFDHNNQIIFYCVNDHKLLCANCMFSVSDANHMANGSPKNTNSKHASHDVKQTHKASVEISNDVKIWQFQMQEKVAELASCEMEWQKQSESYKKIKQKVLKDLDKEYDKLQMHLSTQYMKVKKQIEALSQSYEQNLDKIITSYRTMKRLMIPQRYPIPVVKHSWLEYMKRLIIDMPMNFKDINNAWLKNYQTEVRFCIRRMANPRK